MSTSDYPIVLAHGICRFDHLMNIVFEMDNRDDDSLHYFRRIRSTLAADGFTVFHSGVGWATGVKRRARELRHQLRKLTRDFTRYQKVHLIAHSMGGLDARYMIYRYRMADRVATLSTVGTPHRGSAFADFCITRIDRVLEIARAVGLEERLVRLAERLELDGKVREFAELVGMNLAGFWDLTSERCEKLNRLTADYERANGVKYRTYTGVQTRDKVFLPLVLPHMVIEEAEGENDGLVSLTSAAWRDECFVEKIEADHRNEIGWWAPSANVATWNAKELEERIQGFYLRIARSL